MRIFNKLIGGFFIIAFILLLSSLYGIWNINRVNNSLKYVTSKTWTAANAAMQVSIDNLTRIMAQEEYLRGNKDQAKQLIKKSEDSFFQNIKLLQETGLSDENLISNINILYTKLDALQKLTVRIYNHRNKTRLQLDENAIIWTKAIEKLKHKVDILKNITPRDHQTISSKIIDLSILSLSERAALNNFLSGFIDENEYMILSEGSRSSFNRRILELSGIGSIPKEHISPIQSISIEADSLFNTLFNQHKKYKSLQTELSYNTLRLVETFEMIKDKMNAKMAWAAFLGQKVSQESRMHFIIFAVIGFVVSLFIGIGISEVITRPISNLTTATERIAKGHLEEKVIIKANDEIGQLGNSFNKMSEEILIFTKEIRDKNIQLEQGNIKLSEANTDLRKAIKDLQNKTDELNILNEELKKASRIKSEFLANMSHELRTPMNGIIGFTKLVLKHSGENLRDEDKNNMETVLTSANNLLKLINDILDLSKIETGKTETNAAPFDLVETIESAVAIVNSVISEKRLLMEKNIMGNMPIIVSDQDKVRRILINLLSNSVKFTEKGKITITAKKVLMKLGTEDKTECVLISVSDTGIGIAEKERRIIFQDFQQADGSITRKYGGTGLGLSISRKLALLIGGDITVDSAVGIGSTFSLYFPIVLKQG